MAGWLVDAEVQAKSISPAILHPSRSVLRAGVFPSSADIKSFNNWLNSFSKLSCLKLIEDLESFTVVSISRVGLFSFTDKNPWLPTIEVVKMPFPTLGPRPTVILARTPDSNSNTIVAKFSTPLAV